METQQKRTKRTHIYGICQGWFIRILGLPLGRPMLWELWLRDVGHMRRLYYFRFLLIFFAFFAPMIMGIYYAFENYNLELFNIINFFNLWNKNQILVLWILFITGFYLVFIYLFGFKLKGKEKDIGKTQNQLFEEIFEEIIEN